MGFATLNPSYVLRPLRTRSRSSPGVAPGISERRQTRQRIAAIDLVMHEKPSDERAHSHTYRFFPSAMRLDQIGSIGHRTFDCLPVCANFSVSLYASRSHLYERANPRNRSFAASQQPQNNAYFSLCFSALSQDSATAFWPQCGPYLRPCNNAEIAASPFDPQPALRGKPFLRQEATLVVHLAGAPDPIAEVHVGETHGPRPCDVIEYHESAERAILGLRLVKRIDHGQPVLEHIRQRYGQELAFAGAGNGGPGPGVAPAVFDQPGLNMAVFDHHGVVQHCHVGHPAIVVAGGGGRVGDWKLFWGCAPPAPTVLPGSDSGQ